MIKADTQSKPVVRQMPLYKVLMHNDPVTSFELVVKVLVQVFNKELQTACDLALEAHHRDIALIGIHPLEHAEFLIDQAASMARAENSPLTFTTEPA